MSFNADEEREKGEGADHGMEVKKEEQSRRRTSSRAGAGGREHEHMHGARVYPYLDCIYALPVDIQ